MIIAAFISLVVALWFTFVNIGRISNKLDIPGMNFLIQAVSWSFFIFWLLSRMGIAVR